MPFIRKRVLKLRVATLKGFHAWLVIVGVLGICSAEAFSFSLDEVRMLAQKRAGQPFMAKVKDTNQPIFHLNYEEYRRIQFRRTTALWHKLGLPFELEFYLPGANHKQGVVLHEIVSGTIHEIPFDAGHFDFADLPLSRSAQLAGYAGFKVVCPSPQRVEIASFLDASYFRMVGYGQNYGTSARGLALNTATQDPEEFPAFEEYWITRPRRGESELTVYALMDSVSVCGAYRFIIRPGVDTVAAVKAVLFPRRELKAWGVAPLTSMFLFGENGRLPFRDFRPEVHDVDGLSVHNGRGEWLWRPLETATTMRVDLFADENPKGFGLLQRERRFEWYEDLVANFELRPSVWVQPKGAWGKGAVELIQFPSNEEYSDNVVAFWHPERPLPPFQAVELEYQLDWTTNQPGSTPLARIRSTHIGRTASKPPNLRFVVDFTGGELAGLGAKAPLTVNLDCGLETRPVLQELAKNEKNQAWRLVVELKEPREPVRLRAALAQHGKTISETWDYLWRP